MREDPYGRPIFRGYEHEPGAMRLQRPGPLLTPHCMRVGRCAVVNRSSPDATVTISSWTENLLRTQDDSYFADLDTLRAYLFFDRSITIFSRLLCCFDAIWLAYASTYGETGAHRSTSRIRITPVEDFGGHDETDITWNNKGDLTLGTSPSSFVQLYESNTIVDDQEPSATVSRVMVPMENVSNVSMIGLQMEIGADFQNTNSGDHTVQLTDGLTKDFGFWLVWNGTADKNV